MKEKSDFEIEVIQKGTRAALAAEYFRSFLEERKEKIVVDMNNMVRSQDANSVAFMCRAHVLTEITDMIAALDRAMVRGRNADKEG